MSDGLGWVRGFWVPATMLADFAEITLAEHNDEGCRLVFADAIQDLGMAHTDEMADILRHPGAWKILTGAWAKAWIPMLTWVSPHTNWGDGRNHLSVVAGLKKSRVPTCHQCGVPVVVRRSDVGKASEVQKPGDPVGVASWIPNYQHVPVWECGDIWECGQLTRRQAEEQRRHRYADALGNYVWDDDDEDDIEER